MKKIDKPAINQVEPFQEACNNKKLRKTYPNQVRFSTRAERLASFYDSSGGNPNEVKGGYLSVVEKKAMLDLYDDPPVCMSYISDLRSSLAGETCPMCGGENPTTLDHYLTKKKYPEYALLPYNLVLIVTEN